MYNVCMKVGTLYECSSLKEQLRSQDTEIDHYRKSTTQEQERNEQLTLMLNKVKNVLLIYQLL